jgi:hypothetical protein
MTDKPALGKLEKVDLRDYWKSEAQDFTPWLASKENIALLGETLDLELEIEAQEKEVGAFRADILCKDSRTGQWVLIENQLEPTNHGHLGQLLTYAAGLNAGSIIWIAEEFTNEHRAALDWLNEITGEDFAFFGVEVELWRIGSSAPAPKFNVVSKPNDWAKHIKASAFRELTDARQLQLTFWTEFHEYMANNSKIRCQKPRPQSWMNHSIGRYGCHLASVASTWDSAASREGGELRVELVLDDENSKPYFAQLESQQKEIEGQLGEALTWHNPAGKRMKRIYVRRSVELADRDHWPEFREWLKANLERFQSVFAPRVKAFTTSEVPEVNSGDHA